MDKQNKATQFLLYKAENVVCANFAHTTKHGAIENKTQTTT